MKKTILFLLLFGFAASVKAQELGLRFGNVAFNNVAIDGVIGSNPRIHGDISFGGDGVGVEALWDVINKQLGSEAGLGWYLGVGGTALLANPFWLGISGEIGIEYHFKDAPIALGLDWRPTFFFIDNSEFWSRGFGFNARYVFK
jgi:hypothetical protein